MGDYSEFGAGFNHERGDYITPHQEHLKNKNETLSGNIPTDQRAHSLDTDLTEVSGLILSTIPKRTPFIYKKNNEDTEIEVATIFIGAASLLYRVNFWGDAINDFHKIVYQDPPSIKVCGYQDYDSGTKDIHIIRGADEIYAEPLDEVVNFEPKRASGREKPSEVQQEDAVRVFMGKVLANGGTKERTGPEGDKFEVTHISIVSHNQKALVALYNYHAGIEVEQFDNVAVFSGWVPGESKQCEFVPRSLPDLEYQCEVSVRSFSGVCNLSKHPHIDIE